MIRTFGYLAFGTAALLVSVDSGVGCAAGSSRNLSPGSGDAASSSTSGGGGAGAGLGFGGSGSGGMVGGGVPQTCAQALDQQSNIGCEYWPTVASNSGLFEKFEYAIAAANP